VKTLLERRANGIGPAPRGHVLLARGEKRGTHRGRVLPATAASVALLEISDKRFILKSESEHRFERKLQAFLGFDAQVVIDFETPVAENFSGIEQVPGVEDGLDLAHDFQQFLADLPRHVLSPRHADPMFGGERSLELPDEG
jgi:hypothetical protein